MVAEIKQPEVIKHPGPKGSSSQDCPLETVLSSLPRTLQACSSQKHVRPLKAHGCWLRSLRPTKHTLLACFVCMQQLHANRTLQMFSSTLLSASQAVPQSTLRVGRVIGFVHAAPGGACVDRLWSTAWNCINVPLTGRCINKTNWSFKSAKGPAW